MEWDKKNLAARVEKARGGVPFTKVMTVDGEGRATKIACPGTDFGTYDVIIRWNKERLTNGARENDVDRQGALVIGDKPEHFNGGPCFEMTHDRVEYVTHHCSFTRPGAEPFPRVLTLEEALAMAQYQTVSFEVLKVLGNNGHEPCPGNVHSTLSYHTFMAFMRAQKEMKNLVRICAVEKDAIWANNSVHNGQIWRLRSWQGGGLLWAVVYKKPRKKKK